MKKILIISGGISKERAISLDTGRQVAKELKKNNYFVKIAEPNFQLLMLLKNLNQTKFSMLCMVSLVRMVIFKQY